MAVHGCGLHFHHSPPDGPQKGQLVSSTRNRWSSPPTVAVQASTSDTGETPCPGDGGPRQEKGPHSTSLRNEGVQLTGRGLLSECQGLRRGGGTGRHHQWRWKRLVDGAERRPIARCGAYTVRFCYAQYRVHVCSSWSARSYVWKEEKLLVFRKET